MFTMKLLDVDLKNLDRVEYGKLPSMCRIFVSSRGHTGTASSVTTDDVMGDLDAEMGSLYRAGIRGEVRLLNGARITLYRLSKEGVFRYSSMMVLDKMILTTEDA